ncbi:YbaN family protein [Pseudoalteromonas sp. MMG013]|uniref:YbaN family protein n=1 Tax=Pseudoalteromonas sp. MMG013 TaxID=2822687 RepID=UPI001B3670B6|nr:YbaN family protein [Pseudoalteromonas sp. MMG013]MBQ4862156.1 YbaN family protein [Pseudoalteromonas sp. MMG013]
MQKKINGIFNKCFWLHLTGIVFVALGFIGIVLPVMPTTIFFILALACFTRSSPRFANWLLNHPKFGYSLQQWQKYQVVPPKGKWGAGIGMSLGFLILLLNQPPVWVLVIVAVTELAVLAYILRKPSYPPLSGPA